MRWTCTKKGNFDIMNSLENISRVTTWHEAKSQTIPISDMKRLDNEFKEELKRVKTDLLIRRKEMLHKKLFEESEKSI